jgi:hypothetical protein
MSTKLCKLAVLFSFVVSFHLSASDELQSSVELGQGYRHDSLKFKIAGPHHKPNVISELDYKNLQVYLTTLKATVSNGTYIGVVDVAYGNIIHGKCRDSDYSRNNKRGEYSRSISKISGDYTVDASAKIGRIFPMFSGVTFTPSIGYGAFWQNLHVKDGNQKIPDHHHISHLNSTYKTRWSAPFVDARFSAPLTTSLALDLGYTFFYPIQYTGKGHWNLRHLHFTQKNKAWKSFGQKGDVKLRWACTERLELGFGIGIAQFTAKDGKINFRQYNAKARQPAVRAQRTFVDYLLSLSYSF